MSLSSENIEQQGPLERLDPSQRRDHMATQHWARYEWAAQFLPRARVLDCACGVGYGSALLRRRGAGHVVGVDVSEEAIAEARARYGLDGIEYVCSDALALARERVGTFDLIVSLETIEHVPEPQKLLDAFAGLLNPGGVLALSCPNDAHLGGNNPYHLWTAEWDTLRKWIEQRFAYVNCWGEAHVVGTSIVPQALLETRAQPDQLEAIKSRLVDQVTLQATGGFLFLCGQEPVPDGQVRGALLVDGFDYVRELEQTCRRLWDERRALAAEKDRIASEFDKLQAHWHEQQARLDEASAARATAEDSAQRLHGECAQLRSEATRLSEAWEQQRRLIGELEQQRDAMRNECEQAWQEASRIAGEWETQRERFDVLKRKNDAIWAEARQLAQAWETQRSQIEQLSGEREALANESTRLAQVWETQHAYIQTLERRVRELSEQRDRLMAEQQQFAWRMLQRLKLLRKGKADVQP